MNFLDHAHFPLMILLGHCGMWQEFLGYNNGCHSPLPPAVPIPMLSCALLEENTQHCIQIWPLQGLSSLLEQLQPSNQEGHSKENVLQDITLVYQYLHGLHYRPYTRCIPYLMCILCSSTRHAMSMLLLSGLKSQSPLATVECFLICAWSGTIL